MFEIYVYGVFVVSVFVAFYLGLTKQPATPTEYAKAISQTAALGLLWALIVFAILLAAFVWLGVLWATPAPERG